MFYVCTVHEETETITGSHQSNRGLSETVRQVAELVRGTPGLWSGIRDDKGELVATVETNWRGEPSAERRTWRGQWEGCGYFAENWEPMAV